MVYIENVSPALLPFNQVGLVFPLDCLDAVSFGGDD